MGAALDYRVRARVGMAGRQRSRGHAVRRGGGNALRSSSDVLSAPTIGAPRRFVNLSGRHANRWACTCTLWIRTIDHWPTRECAWPSTSTATDGCPPEAIVRRA